MLDYKIKDLKRDITPQQNEILELKKETNALDSRLKHFNQVNSGLGLTVDDNRNRQEQMQKQITNSRAQIRRNDTYIRQYRKAVHDVAQWIDDYDELKLQFHKNLYGYVADSQRKHEDIDKDIQKEFKAQAKFLENSNKKLKFQLTQMQAAHKQDNGKIMEANIELIADVAALREAVNQEKRNFNNNGGTKALDQIKAAKDKLQAQIAKDEESGQPRHATVDDQIIEPVDGVDDDVHKTINKRKEYIQTLRNNLDELKRENAQMQARMGNNGYGADNQQ